jgi:hypothetical protein
MSDTQMRLAAMMRHQASHRAIIASIAMICAPGVPMARAQDASAWEMVPHGAARLVAGATHKSADGLWLRAGIEIRLDPGWHTYWRYPGDSGVPRTEAVRQWWRQRPGAGCGGGASSAARTTWHRQGSRSARCVAKRATGTSTSWSQSLNWMHTLPGFHLQGRFNRLDREARCHDNYRLRDIGCG